ncbi:hypothetical protein EES45_08455 [Streptomyces sp. ADI97-07]|nr:hypothetical protein EES45_08455 [Streptomyces sp. ADI97-07]
MLPASAAGSAATVAGSTGGVGLTGPVAGQPAGTGGGPSGAGVCGTVSRREEATSPRPGMYQSQAGPSVYTRPDMSVTPPADGPSDLYSPRSPSAGISAAKTWKSGSSWPKPHTVCRSVESATGKASSVSANRRSNCPSAE